MNGLILFFFLSLSHSNLKINSITTSDIVSCSDGIMNGDETGVDCGGINCPPCIVGNTPLVQRAFSHNNVSQHAPDFFANFYGAISSDLEGNRIVWSSYNSLADERKVFTATADGSEKYEIIDLGGTGPLFSPPFTDISPDGQHILFSNGTDKIYLSNFEGTDIKVVVDSIMNPVNNDDIFELNLRSPPQFGGSLATPLNIYFIHTDFGPNGTGQAADRAGLYFVSVDGTTAIPTQIFSAKNVAELYGQDASSYSPTNGLFGPKVSDGNLILFGTNDYGDPTASDLWTNLNTSFSLVTENGPLVSADNSYDISGNGEVVVWKDQLNDLFVIKNITENTLRAYPRFDEFGSFAEAYLSTNYHGNNTLIRDAGVNNLVLINAEGEIHFPLFITKYQSDIFDGVGPCILTKSKQKFFFTSADDLANIWATEYETDPGSDFPRMTEFRFGQNWVLENEGNTHFEIDVASGLDELEFVNFVELNNEYSPFSVLNNFANHYLSNDGSSLGDEFIDNTFTHNFIREESNSIPQVPDTFSVRINLFAENHYSSYDIYPFYLLNAPLSSTNNTVADVFTVVLKPSVVQDNIQIEITSDQSATTELQISNLSGQSFFLDSDVRIKEGINVLNFDLDFLPPGRYQFSIVTEEKIKSYPFVKL